MDRMYGVSYSEDSLMHYRTKGSKNGYSTDPNYKPVGQKAQDNPHNMQEYAAVMQRQAAQQASQKEKEEAARKRQVAMQRIGWLAGKAAEGIGNAVKTSVSTGAQLYNQRQEQARAEERTLKAKERLKQAQYKKLRDEGRAYERSRQSAYSKAKGAVHYKVEEGKRAIRAGKKTLSEVSADIKKKGRDTLAKLGVGDAARDAGRIAERAKEAVSGAIEKGRKKATKLKNQYNIAKNDAAVKRDNRLIGEGYTQTENGNWWKDNGKSTSYVITKNKRKRR